MSIAVRLEYEQLAVRRDRRDVVVRLAVVWSQAASFSAGCGHDVDLVMPAASGFEDDPAPIRRKRADRIAPRAVRELPEIGAVETNAEQLLSPGAVAVENDSRPVR